MSDPKTDPTPGATPAEPNVRRRSRGLLSRLSFVWLVPLLALAISLAVAWQSYSERGILIEIGFENASGIGADRTELRYRDVVVGAVEEVSFSEDLGEVIVAVRVDRRLAPYLDDDAEFWVVQPEVSVRGISGLDTVLSGVYIEGSWDSEAGEAQTRFTGLEEAPLVDPTRPGTPIELRARDGNSIANGAPVLYKGIPVGEVERPELAPNGEGVVIRAFIDAPYDRLLSSNTRFWDISGVSVSLGPGGVSLDFSSLASLVEGGVSFDTLVSGGDPIEPGQVYQLFPNEEAAQSSLLTDGTAETLELLAVFDGVVSGLSEGTAVRFQGVPVGEVTGVAMVAEDFEDRKVVRLNATLAVSPARLGLGDEATTEEALALLDDYVVQGLRARLASASILSNQLVVELIEIPDADPAWIVNRQGRPPELPTADSDFADLNATAQGVFERINDLPIEEVLASAQTMLDSVTDLVSSDDTRAVLPGVTQTLDDMRSVVPEVNETLETVRGAVPDLESTLEEARAMLDEARQVVADIREAGISESIDGALDSAVAAAESVQDAAAGLPPLVARLDSLVLRAEATLSTFGDGSRLVTSTLSTLRSISEAADSLRNLARTLQRNPNSIILGR
ncbi:intermembrane transport protein PqiB [Psychromarinibacter sp. S121]|uniref:PqiB family protein n=1 Tax=Psychromarinibacter sp. S121 TaxID=3415127 RepID=UPI003C7DDE31